MPPAGVRIDVLDEAPAELSAELATAVRQFNAEKAGPSGAQPLAVVARDAGGRLVGGVAGRTVYRHFLIEVVWVDEPLRGSGLGRELMRIAEGRARERGCVAAQVDTLSFQAPRFYERLGFRIVGTVPDFPQGHERHFLVKRYDPEPMASPPSGRLPAALLAVVLVALAVSGIGPRDRFTWWLEAAPVMIGVPILVATRRRFPLTPLLYGLLAAHAVILVVGGHYTYAEVPPGFWVQDAFGFARNHYDRLGHFAQGFVPAILAREILLRRSPLTRGRWLFFLAVCVCLAFSAFYELLEWWAALLTGEAATAFLGTQGDPWDTQWDMFLALVGANTALVTLGRVHDRQIGRLG